MIYADTNVFVDILEADPQWMPWSRAQLAGALAQERLVTGPIVLAELAHYANDAAALEQLAAAFGTRIVPWTIAASLYSGHAYRDYRARGGTRTTILADLLIGGHAMALGATVLTRDPHRFRSYFPDLALITPEENHD